MSCLFFIKVLLQVEIANVKLNRMIIYNTQT